MTTFLKSLSLRCSQRIFWAIFLSSLLIAAASYIWVRDNALYEQRKNLDGLLNTIQNTAQAACFANNAILAKEVTDGLLRNKLVTGAAIWSDNQLLVRTGVDFSLTKTNEISANILKHPIYSPFDNKKVIGQLAIHINPKLINQQAEREIRFVAILLTSQAILLIVVINIVVFKLVVRPVKMIATDLVKLSPFQGETITVPEDHQYDELGLLVGEINRLSERLNSIYNGEVRTRIQLDLAKRVADKANRAKSEFLSSMSHELRTPMNAILGFAQLLEMDNLTEEQMDNVQEILAAGRHLLDLINDVLDLSKIESGKLDITIEKVDLKALLNSCFNLIHPLAAKNNITSLNQIDQDQDFYIMADKTRFKQVLLNLMSNAVKYNCPNGSLIISCAAINPQTLRVNITDTGDGLSKIELAKLFQPFERLSAKNSSLEGTGIGLVISKKLIEAMNGRIGVESTKGEGSCFWIEIPLA